MIRSYIAAAAFVFACGAAANAQPASVLGEDAIAKFQLRPGSAEFARVENVAVSGQAFSKALRVQVTKVPARPQEAQIALPLDAAFAAGDVLLLTYWVRAIESSDPAGEASLDARLQAVTMVPRAGTLSMPADAGKAWKKVQYPIALSRAGYGKGEAELSFLLGYRTQTVELGGLELVNYGSTKRVDELPLTPLGYKGMEPNAPWRAAAKARIEELRKANLTVTVKDQAGKPVKNAVVAVHMRNHAFGFGTAVSGPVLSGKRVSPENVQKYKDSIVQLFNKAVMENDLKWPQWSVEQDRSETLTAVDWLRQNGIAVRGHNLVWPSWRNSPKGAADLKSDPAALAKFTLDHIAQEARALEGRLVDWDVLNEPFSNHDFMDVLGRQSMVDWFKTARGADPNAKLYINDFDILSGNRTEHQNHYFETIQYLLAQGAPVDGIGLQSHFPARITPPEEVLKRLDRFASFKKDLQVTEFDIDSADEVTQAAYTRDFLTVTFSHPSITGFMMWGFWEGSHWRPRGAMIRTDWTGKPNLQAYKDLVFKDWWTDVSGKTSAEGSYSVRGFLGDYEIEVRAGKRTRTVKAALGKGGKTVECVIE